METINILRLKTGEDVICYMEQFSKDEVIVREPMAVLLRTDFKTGKQSVGMDHWLPTALLKTNETVLKLSDVLAVLTPSSEFTEYYEHTIGVLLSVRSKFKEENTSSDDEVLTQEDMSLILDSMDTSNIKEVH